MLTLNSRLGKECRRRKLTVFVPVAFFLPWCILTVRRWYFDAETAQIRSEYDHRCLDVNMGGSANVYIHPCHDGDNQKFVP